MRNPDALSDGVEAGALRRRQLRREDDLEEKTSNSGALTLVKRFVKDQFEKQNAFTNIHSDMIGMCPHRRVSEHAGGRGSC